MSDPNERRIMPVKEIAASPSADATVDTTCASTLGTASQQPSHAVASVQLLPNSREQARRHVLHLGLASSGAGAAFILSVVPLNILIGLTIVLLLWLSFLYQLFQMVRSEHQRALQGRGLGDLLPTSLYESLVNTSFHEFMTDGAFARENQHFLLYFIPGLSLDQLEDYLERLVPRHRRRLYQPGLGNFLGDGFMRHVIGDEGLAERRRDAIQAVPQRLTLISTNSDDTASGLGEERIEQASNSRRLIPRRLDLAVINEDVASRLDDDEGFGVESNLPLEAMVPQSPEEEEVDVDAASEDDSEDLSVEQEVIVDAAVTGAVAFFNFALGYSQNAMANSAVRTGRTLLRATLGMGLISVGAGALGVWSGYLSPQDFRFPRQLSPETRTMLLSSTIASGATAGLFMLFGYSRGGSPPTTPHSKSSSDRGHQKKR